MVMNRREGEMGIADAGKERGQERRKRNGKVYEGEGEEGGEIQS